eukprot:g17978.t1
MARGHGKKNGKGRKARKAASPSFRDEWNVLVNPAGGDCGLYTMLQLLLMKKRGVSASEAVATFRRAAGTPEMRELLMACRRRVVKYVRGSPHLEHAFTDGKDVDGDADGDARSNIFTTMELKSLAEWEEAILKEGSYIDGTAILGLGRIFEIPDVRIVYEDREIGLVNEYHPNYAVEPTGQPTVLWSGGNHFEAMVPVAHDASIKASTGNDTASAMDFCLLALNRPADYSDFVDAVISFVRRIPRRTGTVKRVHKTRGTRKWSRGRTPLTRGRVYRFRDIYRGLRSIRGGEDGDDSAVPSAPAAPVDAGSPPAAPGGWDDMQPPVAPAAQVDAGSPPAAPGGWDDMDASETPGASVGEVAPAFDGAIPSAPAPSTTPSADSAESSSSSTESAPSAPSSTDSPGGEDGGGPDEDTPEDRDAMDVSEAPEANSAPPTTVTKTGSNININGDRRGCRGSGRDAKRKAGGGGGRGRGGKRKTGGGGCRSSGDKHKSDGGGGGGDGNDDDGAAPMEVSDDGSGDFGGDFGGGDSSDVSSVTSSPDTSEQQEDLAEVYNREMEASSCLVCGENDDIPNTLLCARPIGRKEDDKFCDKACHLRCTDLEDVPEGDWYCPECLEGGFVPPPAPSLASDADSTYSSPEEPEPSEFGGAIPPVSASSAPSSTDSRNGGKGGGNARGKGKRKGKGRGKGKRKRIGNGHTDIGDLLCKPWNDAVRRIMEKREKQALEQVIAFEETVDKTTRVVDKLTYLGLVRTLVGGLTDDGEGQLEITPGEVFFKRNKLPSLEKFYNRNAKYEPADVGVELGKTCVKIGGVVYTVESFEDGLYSLKGSDIEIGQWELLEKRCAEDGGAPGACVTLEDDQKRYILSLIASHENMWRTYIPYLEHGQVAQKYVDEVGTEGMLENWSNRKLSSEEREELKSVANMRRLSKLAFLDASVADIFHTLPVGATQAGEDGHEEATFLRNFAGKKGSLCDLSGLGRLGEKNVSRDRRDATVMVKKSTDDDVHGSYHAHIDHAVELLQYAYRLNRVVSLHEAYLPLCIDELEILRRHFTCWSRNEREDEHFTDDCYDIRSRGGMTVAMRFSLERSGHVIPAAPPAMIRVLSRDQDEHGTLQHRSVHTGITSKVAKAFQLQKFIMDGSSRETTAALEKVYGRVGKFLRKKRNESGHEEGEHSGLHGPALRVRKSKAPFVGFSNEECLEMLELLFEGLYQNGMKKVLDAIDEVDKECGGKTGVTRDLCYDILKAAQVAAQNTSKKAQFKEEQLQGDEDQKARIAAVVRGLKARKITRKDLVNASVAVSVRDMLSSASLRNQGFFFRLVTRLCIEHRRESRNLGKMVAGLPKKSKVSKHGNGSGNGVAREHVIDDGCAEWHAITNVIGRPFFRSFDDYDGKQSPYIGPVDEKGHAMSQKRFNRIVRKIGRSYLGVFNLSFNQLRSALTSLVFAECTKLGKRMDDPVVQDFASTILTSVKTMRKQYDIHRAARPLDRGIHEKYKGVVDFCGGAYGILKGAVQRERAMRESGGGELRDAVGEREKAVKEREKAVGEREQAVGEREQAVGEREQAVGEREQAVKERGEALRKREKALNARSSGEPQSQAANGSATGETGDHEAGVGENSAPQPTEHQQAPKAKTTGAVQSQCIGEDHFEVEGKDHVRRCDRPAINGTSLCADHQQKAAGGSSSDGDTSDSDAGVGEKRTAEQVSGPDAKCIKKEKVREIKDGEREGMLVVLGAIKAAHVRARKKVKEGGDDAEKYAKILQKMEKPRCRDEKGHYGMVKHLLEYDDEFNPGSWYMGSEFGKAPPEENKQKSFVALKDQLTRNDAESDVADKFVWKWYTPAEKA